jgi:PPP family 3-phenylpropionic acid transporter
MIEVFYFFFFTAVGVYMPYLPVYFRGLGLSGGEISTVLSVTPLMALGVPLGWAWVADRTKRHARLLQIVSLGALVGIFPLLFARRFPTILASYLGYAVFAVGIGGLADSLAIGRMRTGSDYGRMRLWGSLGFMVAALGTGLALTARGARSADPVVPALVIACFVASFAASLSVRGSGEPSVRPHLADVKRLLADRRFRLLLTVAPLHWMCCAPYHVFFGIFLGERRLSPLILGLSFCIGIAAEIAVLLGLRSLRRRFTLESLLAVAFAGSVVRWVWTSQADSTFALMALQSLHGLTFGLFWGAGVALVAACVPPQLKATGQTLFLTSMVGVGNILGNLLTGLIYDRAGAATAFLAAGVAEVIPLALVLRAGRGLRSATATDMVGPDPNPPPGRNPDATDEQENSPLPLDAGSRGL